MFSLRQYFGLNGPDAEKVRSDDDRMNAIEAEVRTAAHRAEKAFNDHDSTGELQDSTESLRSAADDATERLRRVHQVGRKGRI